MQQMDPDAVEQVSVLTKHECFWAFPYQCRLRQDKHVFDLLDGDEKPNAIARMKTPNQSFVSVLVIGLRLVFQRQIEGKGAAWDIN